MDMYLSGLRLISVNTDSHVDGYQLRKSAVYPRKIHFATKIMQLATFTDKNRCPWVIIQSVKGNGWFSLKRKGGQEPQGDKNG